MTPTKDSKRYYRLLRPDLLQIIAEQIEAEDYQLLALTSRGVSSDAATVSRMHPGRVELLSELIEILDKKFGLG